MFVETLPYWYWKCWLSYTYPKLQGFRVGFNQNSKNETHYQAYQFSLSSQTRYDRDQSCSVQSGPKQWTVMVTVDDKSPKDYCLKWAKSPNLLYEGGEKTKSQTNSFKLIFLSFDQDLACVR